MKSEYKKQLEKNIGKYAWFKVFTKRVYLPLIAIQLVNVGKVTVEELAAIAVIASIVQIVLQLPTGYIADKLGNKLAIVIGSAIASVSPLFYIFMPNFAGGALAASVFFGGYSFQSGAVEAFIHDTLVALKKEKEYSKVMGRAQSYGLLGNVVLISLIPATYAINTSLPFFIGFLSLMATFWLAISFTYPKNETIKEKKNPFAAIKSIVTFQNLALFVFAGFMAGVSNKTGTYRELLFQDLGVAVSIFGILLAIGSIAGAIMGRYIHVLDKLKPMAFYLFDLIFMTICIVMIGATTIPAIAIIGFTLFAGYTRVRMIVFQAKLLHEIKHVYKATLMSALSLFTIVGDIGVITILSQIIGFNGYSLGYLLFGFATFGMGLVFWLVMAIEGRVNGSKRNTINAK